ncbi:hypothetical protein [Agrococcus sp. DT81.2]|uniref:hypothetical protein n=1 Tax=Agrococcus sp. DT81.2 TaxID=3393414 RepID=UPI003CE5AB83
MNEARSAVRTYTDADVDTILADLNAPVPGHEDLHAWSDRSGIPCKRVVATADLTYVRLAGQDRAGGYIVLMLLDGTWERVI